MNPAMPVNTEPATGDRFGRFGIQKNALNAVFAISFVRIWLSKKPRTDILKQTSIIVKDAEYVLKNALPGV